MHNLIKYYRITIWRIRFDNDYDNDKNDDTVDVDDGFNSSLGYDGGDNNIC